MFITRMTPKIACCAEKRVVLTPADTGLDVTLLPSEMPVKELRLTWEYDMARYTKVLADAWGVSLGDLGWKARGRVLRAEWYFAMTDGETTVCFGVKTGCNSFCSWEIGEKNVTLVLDVKNGGEGVALAEPLLCATVLSAESEGESAYAALRRFCGRMCEKPNLPKRPVYGFNNWYYAYGNITRESVMKDAELCALLASGLPKGAPKPFCVIDDGWQASRDPAYNGGPFAPNANFGDMKAIAEEIAARGCAPGIWVRSVCVLAEKVKLPRECYSENQEMFVRDKGKLLDPTTAGAREYIFSLIRTLSDSGYALIKHDFSAPDLMGNDFLKPHLTRGGWHFKDKTKTNAQVMKDFYRLVQDAAGDSVVIGCNTYNHLAAGIHEVQRSGADTSGYNWGVTKKNGINSLVYRLCQNDIFFKTDADCAVFTQHVPTDKNILFADLISCCNSALFVSAAPGILQPADVEKLIAIYARSAAGRSNAVPLDWQEKETPEMFLCDGEIVKYEWD